MKTLKSFALQESLLSREKNNHFFLTNGYFLLIVFIIGVSTGTAGEMCSADP